MQVIRMGKYRAEYRVLTSLLHSGTRQGPAIGRLEHRQGPKKRWLRLPVIDPATRQAIDRITFPLALRKGYNLHYSSCATARGACLYFKRFLEEQDRWTLWPWCLEPVPSSNIP
ncbi:MAG: hypothetical protein Q9M35_11355 [Rhodothermus sp.]|nr:hypothetical protein [Rhodothermus sp.]